MALDYPEEHRREALLITIGIHVLLALICFFVVFRGPDPPLTEMGGSGVELNYGLDEAGSGDIQSVAPANDSPNREDSRPPAPTPDPQPQPVAATPPEPTPPAEEKIITSDAEESPVAVLPVTKVAPPKEEVKEIPKAPRKVAVTFTPKAANTDGGGNGVNGSSNAPTGNNNGDRPGSVGDQGSPDGTLNGDALYGKRGTGGAGPGGSGGGLEMAGWAFDDVPSIPKIDDTNGLARFKIKINAEGEVESVTKVSSNLSPAQEKAVRDALMNASFRHTTGSNGAATGFYNFRYSVR